MLENQTVRKTAVVTLTMLALFLLAKTIGEFQSYKYIGSNPSSASQIQVSGKGEVVKVPDLALFSFGVTEESRDVSKAQAAGAVKMKAILAYLEQNGVNKKDITTSAYTIYPRYEYPDVRAGGYQTGKQVLAAYVVTQTVTVKVRTLDDTGKLISGVGELGATDISNFTFDFDKRDELIKEARDKAIKEARTEADKLAKSLGVTLVRIISYNDNGNYRPMYAKAYDVELQASNGSATAAIPVGEDKIISNVTITYEVK